MLWACIYGYNECTLIWSSVVGAHRLGRLQNRIYIYISLQPTKALLDSTVRYFVAPYKLCKWSGVLAQAIQLTAVQDVDETHQTSDVCYK